MEFDASLDLRADLVPDNLTPREAVELVRAAVEALPGAGWISVAWCGHCPPVPWVRVYKPGRGEAMEGGEWDLIEARIKAAAMAAVIAPAG
jgi:hypothetical protein